MMSQKELSSAYRVDPSVISRTIGTGPQFYLLVVVINLRKALRQPNLKRLKVWS